MRTLKDHQAAMVYLLSQETAIPTSAIRLAHALHDVLAHLNNTNVAPVAHTERRIDATTTGLNDAMLAEAIKTCSGKIMSGVQKQSEDFGARFNEKNIRNLVNETRMVKSSERSLESLLKQRDNTIRQLKGRVANLVKERDELKDMLGTDPAYFREPEQAGCRKEDTEAADDGWIAWGGGECPVDGEVAVEIKFRNGAAGGVTQQRAITYRWTDEGGDWDIIAYRVVKS